MVQFAMAMVGAIALATLSWNAVGGGDAVLAASLADVNFNPDTLRFLPAWGEGTPFDASFWTIPIAALAVYLGVSWWGSEGVDGSGVAVQRILASKDDRQGMLATLWYNIAHYALRPWPWIVVGLASLLVLPHVRLDAPVDGTVRAVDEAAIELVDSAGTVHRVALTTEGAPEVWSALAEVEVDDQVRAGDLLAETDSERAYVAMMVEYLPLGLLGLMVASLLAAFMSTIDTHVNLAASFFVNDLYRRFLWRRGSPRHYVIVAQLASIVVLAMGAILAYVLGSISDAFLFFLSLLGGVGPVYVARWLWWRVRASTEIVAVLASSTATVVLTFVSFPWPDTALSPGGDLAAEGRLCLVVGFAMACALVSILVTRRPDPADLVAFYRRVRPAGWWGPVRALTPDVPPVREGSTMLVGAISGLLAIYGPMFGTGCALLGRWPEAALAGLVALAGIVGLGWALGRISTGLSPAPDETPQA